MWWVTKPLFGWVDSAAATTVVKVKLRHPRGVALQLADPHEVRVVGDTEDQVDRVLGAA